MKPATLYVRKSAPVPVTQAAHSLGPAITNFGFTPGFRIAARMETSASTTVRAPVTAVIEYNYEHNGQIVIPAGSRAIGRIDSADSHGYMGFSFEEIVLPGGTSVPISAIAVDTNLRTLKGVVKGNSRKVAMAVATMSGIGQTAAMSVGNSNSSVFSSQDMLRERAAQNMGNTADTQVQSIMSNQRVTVTLGAGTEMYLVFRKPAVVPDEYQSSVLHPSTQPIPVN
jgi:type IV secretory pathway VirB10-like protein